MSFCVFHYFIYDLVSTFKISVFFMWGAVSTIPSISLIFLRLKSTKSLSRLDDAGSANNQISNKD